MTASVVLIRTVDVVDTTAFVRDILAYMLANLLVLCFLWNGQLAAWEASLLILLYVVYVAVACYTSRSALFVLCPAENVLEPMLCHSTERPHVCLLLSTCASGNESLDIFSWTVLVSHLLYLERKSAICISGDIMTCEHLQTSLHRNVRQ